MQERCTAIVFLALLAPVGSGGCLLPEVEVKSSAPDEDGSAGSHGAAAGSASATDDSAGVGGTRGVVVDGEAGGGAGPDATAGADDRPGPSPITPEGETKTDVGPRVEGNGRTLALGGEFSCAIDNGDLYCWGSNSSGQLGDGANSDKGTPQQVPGLSDIVQVAASLTHVCALSGSGSLWCWGAVDLGDGTADQTYNQPQKIGLRGVVEVTAGLGYTCVRMASNTAKCWGSNYTGQLGDGTTEDRLEPVDVHLLSGVAQIAAGNSHTCARLNSGLVSCWGNNARGKVGGDENRYDLAQEVAGVSDAVEIAVGSSNTCARLASGSVYCWGERNDGMLGDGVYPSTGTIEGRSTPEPVTGIDDAIQIAASHGQVSPFLCALRSTRTLQCWGGNYYYGLGDGTMDNRYEPVTVLDGVVEVAAGGEHACARLASGTLKCWGTNEHGQVGDGTPSTRSMPVGVKGFEL